MMPDAELVALRFGQGLPLPLLAPLRPADMLDRLRGPDLAVARFPVLGLEAVLEPMTRAQKLQADAKDNPAMARAAKAAKAELESITLRATRSTIARALNNPDGFRERLVAFWAGHFTTRSRQGLTVYLPTALTEEAIRPHLAGRFGDLLTAATLHPAMLAYLDQTSSFGPGSPRGIAMGRGLNENLAREVIELHSLGVGAHYTQTDVRQMAELLTGLTFDASQGMHFDARRAEPGAETVLGRGYSGPGIGPILRVLQDLALRPETARHIAGKLARHFIADRPAPDLVAAMARAYMQTGGELVAVYDAMLAHPAAWFPVCRKVRQPYDFVIAALRALGIGGEGVLRMADRPFCHLILAPMRAMGQGYQQAGGPNGWPEDAESWITPPGLAARIAWAMTVPGLLLPEMPDPVALARRALGSRATGTLLLTAGRAESRREGVGLVLASAEMNRR